MFRSGTYPYGASAHYASSALPSIQGVTGNNVYAAPGNLDLVWRDDPQLIEFDKDHLRLVEKLGEGQFGEVSMRMMNFRMIHNCKNVLKLYAH